MELIFNGNGDVIRAVDGSLTVEGIDLGGSTNINAGIATFSGNVNVGGVLTYEDVKNVDSVGIITARSGIDCNGTLEVSSTSNFDGDVQIADTILHLGDTNTKIRFPGADQIQLETNGGNRLYIQSDGKIGINRSSNLSSFGRQVLIDGTFGLNNDSGAVGMGFHSGTSNCYGYIGTGAWAVNGGAADDFGVSSGSTGDLLLGTAATERLRIDSSGRLLKSGQAALTSTSLNHPVQIAADSEAQNIVCFGRAADDIGEISFYEADKSTRLGELQYRRDHLNFRHRVGDIRFATGGTTERVRITSTGKLLYGNHINDRGSELQYEGSQHAMLGLHRNTADHGAPAMTFSASRGTSAGSNTIVQSGDYLGMLTFKGADGSDLASGAYITGIVDGTPGSNDMPARLGLWTSADGSQSPTERLRITSGGTLYSYSPDDVTPNIALRSNDTNWHGYLTQTVHGGSISTILSCGGKWNVDGSTYAATKDYNGSFPTAALVLHNQYNGTNGNNLVFLSKASGSSTTDGTVTERFRIDSGGRVTKPNNPSFHVGSPNQGGGSSGEVWVSHSNAIYSNIGGHYNSSNGRFTAPVNGQYFFFHWGMSNTSGQTCDVYSRKNGSRDQIGTSYNQASGAGHDQFGCSYVRTLSAGDYVDVYTSNGNVYNASDGRHGGWGGWLIG